LKSLLIPQRDGEISVGGTESWDQVANGTYLVRESPKLKVLAWKPLVLIVVIGFDRQSGQMFACYLKLFHYRFFPNLFQLIIR